MMRPGKDLFPALNMAIFKVPMLNIWGGIYVP